MYHPSPRKRIVTCQGSIQLVTALSVMRVREQELAGQGYSYENYLVIYDLSAPNQQLADFVTLIQTIAATLYTWKTVLYLTAEQMDELKQQQETGRESLLFQLVYDVVGTHEATEIYLCRNWQFSNQLFMNAYQSATKICYGDSIGLYFSANSSAFFAQANPTSSLQWLQQRGINSLRQGRNFLQALLSKRTLLKSIPFNIGYFVLPTALGEAPPMPYRQIPSTTLLGTIATLRNLVDPEMVNQFQAQLGDLPIAILLTSNFSEATRMSVENELLAYLEFIKAADLAPETVLVIKPHPRDDLTKIRLLQQRLTPLFAKVVVLDASELFFLPFEIFFYQALVAPQSRRPIQVFAVSSACLGLQLLFDLPSQVGFGPEITCKYFYPEYVAGRLAHEQDLTQAIQFIAGSADKPAKMLPYRI